MSTEICEILCDGTDGFTVVYSNRGTENIQEYSENIPNRKRFPGG